MHKKDKYQFVSTVIVAAGRGARMNMDTNKQFIEIGGLPVLARTLRQFEECSCIDEVILVVNESDILYCKQNIVDEYCFKKVKCIVAGGSERQESVFNGLKEVEGSCDIALVHDGARPFIQEDDIAACVSAAGEFGAACVAVPVKDTIKVADSGNYISSTPDRSTLWAIQTPQAFKYDLVMKAYNNANEDNFKGTDDAMLVERLGTKIKLVMGSYFNIKITTREDLILAEAIAEFYKS